MMKIPEIKSQAPARICLFGDHQDYLNLPVIACAINKYIKIKGVENNSMNLIFRMKDLKKKDVIPINKIFESVKNEEYIKLTLKVLRKYGCVPNKGFNISISGDIPIKEGLSSSSAMVISLIKFFIAAFGINIKVTPKTIARLAYEIEVIEQNSSGGKMDQYSISIGNTIFFDTLSEKIEIINNKINTMVVGVSGEKKDTLNMLSYCKKNQIESIKEVKKKYSEFDIRKMNFNNLDLYLSCVANNLKPFFIAATKNYKITMDAFSELNKKNIDMRKLGNLMNEHHFLLKNNLKITTKKIDKMIESTHSSGAYGSKIIGSGGGGCIVTLCEKKNVFDIIENLKLSGAKDAFEVRVC